MKRTASDKAKRKQKSSPGVISEMSEKFSLAVTNSPVGKAFGAAAALGVMLKSGGLYKLYEKINFNDGMLRKTRRAVVRSIENSRILHYLRRAVEIVLNKPLRTYGLLFIFTALMGGGMFCLGYFDLLPTGYDTDRLIHYAIMLIAALPMLFSGRSLIETVNDSVFTGRFLKKHIAMDRQKLRGTGVTATDGFTCLLVAAVITVISAFVPLTDIFLTVGKAAGIIFLFYNPECGLMLSLMLMPIVPTGFISAVLLLTVVSFIIKLIRVKRSFSLDLADILALMLFFYRLILTAAGGKGLEFTYILLMSAYFLTKNLVLTKHQLSVAFSCITFGVITGSLLRLTEYWLNYSGMFPAIKEMLVWDALWRTDAFCQLCVIALPMCLAWVINRFSGWHLIGYALTALPVTACVILTGNGNEWAAITLSLFIYLVLAYRTRLVFLIMGCVCVPAVCIAAFGLNTPVTPGGSIYTDMLFLYGIAGIVMFIAVLFTQLQVMFSAKSLSRCFEEFDAGINTGKYHGPVSAAGAVMICTAVYGIISPLASDACMLLFWTATGLAGSAANMFEGRGVPID